MMKEYQQFRVERDDRRSRQAEFAPWRCHRPRCRVGTPAPSDIVIIVVVAGIGVPTRETQVAQAETEVRISGTSREKTVAQIVVVDGHIELMIRRIAEIQHAVAYFPIETVVTAREGAVLVEVNLLTPTRAGSVVIRLEKHIGVARIELHALSRDGVDHA